MSIFHPFVWLFKQFTSLFNTLEKEFNKLEPAVQVAIKDSTGIISIFSSNLSQTPDFVVELLQKAYPGYTVAHLQTTLSSVLHDADLVEGILDPDFNKTIENLQSYLSKLNGVAWASAVKSLRDLLAIALNPNAGTWQKVALFGEWVYQNFFKK